MVKLNIFRPADYNLCENCYHSISHDLLDSKFYTCVLKEPCFHVLITGSCPDYIDKCLIDDELPF